MTKKNTCRLCNSTEFKDLLTLGKQPLSGVFPLPDQQDPTSYELKLIQCNDKECNLIQLETSPPVEDMYGFNYGYHSSISPLMVNHLKNIASITQQKAVLSDTPTVLDIGCNDATLLSFFDSKKFKRYGMDPSSKKFMDLIPDDISIVDNLFSAKLFSSHFPNTTFDIISSIAMFYDLDDPLSFMKDIESLLKPNGAWVCEFSYLPLMLSNLTYDQICHEHVTYLGLKQIQWLVDRTNLTITDVQTNEINGGSILVFFSKKNSDHAVNQSKIDHFLNLERSLYSNSSYSFFSQRISHHKYQILSTLDSIKKAGQTVYGYGASTKGNIILNYCKLTNKEIPFICDKSPKKHGLVPPGSRIPIISQGKMRNKNPDYLFVLIWPFRKEILQDEKDFIENGGKLIFHLPHLHIVDQTNYIFYLNQDFSMYNYALVDHFNVD